MMTVLASMFHLRHNLAVLKTKGTGFDSPNTQGGRTATRRFSFVRSQRAPSMGGGGGRLRPAGDLECRSVNPSLAAHPFDSGSSFNATQGGHDMAALPIPARSAHTFPQTEKAARRAVRRWYAGTPYLSLAEWRDQARLVHCARLPADPAREAAFDQAFAQELAAVIAGGASHV